MDILKQFLSLVGIAMSLYFVPFLIHRGWDNGGKYKKTETNTINLTAHSVEELKEISKIIRDYDSN